MPGVFDTKLLIEIITFVLTGSALYWKLHFTQKEVKKQADDMVSNVKECHDRIDGHDKAIADINSRIQIKTHEFELKIEKRFADNSRVIGKRLDRMEKILIKIDERMCTKAAGQLLEDDHEEK